MTSTRIHRDIKVYVMGLSDCVAPPANLVFLELFDYLFQASREFSSLSKQIIENLQFVVQIEVFHKNTFFALPPPTLVSVAQTTHA